MVRIPKSHTIRKLALMACVFAVVVVAGLPQGNAGSMLLYDRIAAVVEDKVITVRDVLSQMMIMWAKWQKAPQAEAGKIRQEMYTEILNAMIDEALLDGAISKSKITVADKDVDAAIEGLMAANRITSKDIFKRALAAQGIEYTAYRERIRTQIRHKRFLSYRIGRAAKVDEEEIRQEYRRREKEAEKQISCDMGFILLKNDSVEKAALESQAGEILATAQQPDTDFIALGTQHDQSSSAEEGGFRHEYRLEEWAHPLQVACLDGSQDTVYPKVVELSRGLAVVKLYARTTGTIASYDDMRREIHNKLFGQRVEKLTRNLIDRLRAKAYIRIMTKDAEIFFASAR